MDTSSQHAAVAPPEAVTVPRRLPPLSPRSDAASGRWSPRPASLLKILAVGIAATIGWYALDYTRADVHESAEITELVRRGSLRVEVVAGGELQSAVAVDVVCEAEGQQIKIIEMLSEGTEVAKDQVVIRCDTTDIRKTLGEARIKVIKAVTAVKTAEEELKIQQNKGASVVAQAGLVKKLAELDLRKYEEGEYGVLVSDLQGLIALAKTDVEEATITLEHYKKLVKQGFRTPEQLRAKEEAVMRARYFLTRDEAKLRVLERFTRERQLTELRAKAEEAMRELGRAKSSATALRTKAENDLRAAEEGLKLEQQAQANWQKQLERYTIKAPQAGVVVYAPATTEEARIRPGAVVHFKQKLFSLPNMSRMQVKAYVHESVVGKVKPNLPAEVRIDAYPNSLLRGKVTHVSTFYDPEREWMSGGVKEYAAFVEIENLPEIGLKPGMTAEVNILVSELSDALLVPVQAVAESRGEQFVFRQTPNGFERRAVRTGANNDRFVVIEEGLSEKDAVALDARTRASTSAP